MINRRASFIAWRFYLIISLIIIVAIGLVWRVFSLAILDRSFLLHQGDERVLRFVGTPAFRGMIVDRNGSPLAVSTTVYSVWVNPQEFNPTKELLLKISHLLKMDPKIISSVRRFEKSKREFVYLKRGLAPELAHTIKLLNIPGVYTQQEYRRYYPEGEVTAHVIGFTNVDDRGQEGLELAYNQWLQGEPGKKWVVKDRLGSIISDVQTVRDQKPGNDLVLSLDKRIQYLAYRELTAGLAENHAFSGSVIVLDVKTGEVLAMVNQPSFNPNKRPLKMTESIRNRAVTDIFEPGSTIKAFTVASALETKKYTLHSIIDTAPGWMRVDRNMVKDEKNNGALSLAQILQLSSNVGAAKIVLSLPPDQLWSLLNRVGFGEITGVGFPGEQAGSLIKREPWGSFVLATLSFGYGISVSALQLARAYAILANDGVRLPLSLLKTEKSPEGERVLDSKLSKQMLSLLETVVKGGTGKMARVPGYRIAGKTGTAKMVGKSGYEQHRYTSSFVGIAPVSNPRLVVAVVINDPQGKYYLGGKVCAPIFERIMEGALRVLNIPPDGL